MTLTVQAPQRHATPAVEVELDVDQFARSLGETNRLTVWIYQDYYRREMAKAVAAGNWTTRR